MIYDHPALDDAGMARIVSVWPLRDLSLSNIEFETDILSVRGAGHHPGVALWMSDIRNQN